MSPWLLLFIVAAIKIPMAAVMLWLPFRSDKALPDDEPENPADGGDGGIKAPPEQPLEPHPRGPRNHPRRRGPHGGQASPRRVRLPSLGRQGSRLTPR
jgi:hypothetical protein